MGFDRAERMARAGREAEAAHIDALIVAPGPDLVYLAGYDPPPLERPTVLIVRPASGPVLVLPELERPRALQAGVGSLAELVPWRDGEDPYVVVRSILGDGSMRLAASDRMWATHLMALTRELGDKLMAPFDLEGVAGLAAVQGAFRWAAQLWGAAEALREGISFPLPPSDRAGYEQAVSETRAQLGEEAFAAAWQEGRAMPLEQVIDDALKLRDEAGKQ